VGTSERWDVVVVGAGFAGLSTAIWARRLGLCALVLEQQDREGGQLRAVASRIADYPGLEPLEPAALSLRLRTQAESAGAVLRLGEPVMEVDGLHRRCITGDGPLEGGAVVMATGVSPRRLGIPGEEEWLRRGLARRPSEEREWFRDKAVVVVGGGDRAAENALLLAGVASSVTLAFRGEELRAQPRFIQSLRTTGQILLAPKLGLESIFLLADERLWLKGNQRGQPWEMAADALCVYIGNRPNSDLLQGQVTLTADESILVDANGETSLPGIYAVGDVCTAPAFQSLATAGGQAMVVAKQIALRAQER